MNDEENKEEENREKELEKKLKKLKKKLKNYEKKDKKLKEKYGISTTEGVALMGIAVDKIKKDEENKKKEER